MRNSNAYMKRALDLAFKGYGQTSPNPLVGAVVVRSGRIVGEGYHAKAGLPHAEVGALKEAGKRARGADLYVNLEPCCHIGRTPPCTDAIIAAGIKRVFFGMLDPNPKVKGKGIRILSDAGVKVRGPVLENDCRLFNRAFIKYITSGVPFVTAKIAITLDGKIADKDGRSKWISNEDARLYAHWLRAGHDVVMVGANTEASDRPRLTVRLPHYRGKQPVPIVVKGSGGKRVDLKKLLRDLGDAGFQSVLVEGGGRLHSSLLKAGLIDHMVIVIAPKLLGGDAIPWITNIGARLSIDRVFTLGDNIVIEGVPQSGRSRRS